MSINVNNNASIEAQKSQINFRADESLEIIKRPQRYSIIKQYKNK